jgi:nitronate monooxygenase
MLTLDGMHTELTAIKAQTEKPFNVNFFCHRQPSPDTRIQETGSGTGPQREAVWRAALLPYYEEFDIDPETIPAGPRRGPRRGGDAAVGGGCKAVIR